MKMYLKKRYVLKLSQLLLHEGKRTFGKLDASYPASRLKLYIQEVEAALKTLHHIK